MISSDIISLMHDHWYSKFKRQWGADVRERKVLLNRQGQVVWEVIFSEILQGWYQSPERKKCYAKPNCFFCDQHDEFTLLRQVTEYGHMGVFDNLKFCEPQHYLITPAEHREHVTEQDVLVLSDLSKASKLSIIGNFRDAGASYPQHVHYQTLETVFSSINGSPVESLWSEGFCVEALDYPELLVHVKPLGANNALFAKMVASLPSPYNLLFWDGSVYMIPRTKSVPSNTQGTKFATAEVFGKVYCRNRAFYNSLDYAVMAEAMAEVCLPSASPAAEKYWDQVKKLAKEAM